MAFAFNFDLENTYEVTALSAHPGHEARGWDPPEPAEVDLGGPVRVWPPYGAAQRKFGSMAECTEWITFETFVVEAMLYFDESEEQVMARLQYACLQALYEDHDDL